MEVGDEIHLKAGTALVIEAAKESHAEGSWRVYPDRRGRRDDQGQPW
jgi:hypothetical protein